MSTFKKRSVAILPNNYKSLANRQIFAKFCHTAQNEQTIFHCLIRKGILVSCEIDVIAIDFVFEE